MGRTLYSLLLIAVAAVPVTAHAANNIVDPADFGFATEASSETNAAALQKALDGGKRIVQVTRPGVYGIDRTVWIDNDTRLVFNPGVVLQKRGSFVQILANRGLADHQWNENIAVEGMTLDVNGVGLRHKEDSPMYGNIGQVAFCRIRNLRVRDFTCRNLDPSQFGIQIAAFENVVIDGFEIRGKKDGIHVNTGRKFVIRNGITETGDDGIALNAEDWVVAGPMLGDIEDGLIENVTDEGNTQCNFCRILTGAWVDWHKGIRVQRGDTVRCGKNLYRVVMPLATKEYVSEEEPSHTHGLWTDKSGLIFWHIQDNGAMSANIRNVTFRNIYLRSPRNGFFADWETQSQWNRSMHPEVKPENYPVCEVRLEDVYSESPRPLVSGNESVRLWLQNVYKSQGPLINLHCGTCDINVRLHLAGVMLKNDDGKGADISVNGKGASLNMTIDGLMQDRDLRLSVGAGVHARANGIGSINTLNNLTPIKGDSVKVNGELKTFDGAQWR